MNEKIMKKKNFYVEKRLYGSAIDPDSITFNFIYNTDFVQLENERKKEKNFNANIIGLVKNMMNDIVTD